MYIINSSRVFSFDGQLKLSIVASAWANQGCLAAALDRHVALSAFPEELFEIHSMKRSTGWHAAALVSAGASERAGFGRRPGISLRAVCMFSQSLPGFSAGWEATSELTASVRANGCLSFRVALQSFTPWEAPDDHHEPDYERLEQLKALQLAATYKEVTL